MLLPPLQLQSRASEPFLRLRETTLGYTGPDTLLTNLAEIRIGWFGPTNLDDPLNGDLWWSANLALREANEHPSEVGRGCPQPAAALSRFDDDGGLGTALPYLSSSGDAGGLGTAPPYLSTKFRLIPRWTADPWGSGVVQLTRMVYIEQPLAILGSIDSASTHLAEQVVAKANLPLVSPVATDKSITLAGVSWMFSCAPDDDVIARVLVDHVLAAPGQDATAAEYAARIALVSFTDHESRMTAREVVREFSRRGCMPALRLELPPGARNFSRQLAVLEEAPPAAVVIVAGPEDSARLVNALLALNPITQNPARINETSALPIYGTHAMSRTRFLDLAGAAAEGVCFPTLFMPDANDTITRRFLDRFKLERGHAPDYAAALAYDGTRLLIEAIQRAGPSRARLREALTGLSPWQGIAGRIDFDGTGQNTRTNISMATIRGGTLVPLEALRTQRNLKSHNSADL